MVNGKSTHSKVIGYVLWLFGFTGSHRFYYGKPVSGTIYFFTFGLLLIGWIVDLFLIPSMDRQADLRFETGPADYNIAWILLVFLGLFGISSFLSRQMAQRHHLSAYRWIFPARRAVRFLDPQRPNIRSQSYGLTQAVDFLPLFQPLI